MAPVVFLWIPVSFRLASHPGWGELGCRFTGHDMLFSLCLSAENSGAGNMHQHKQPLIVCGQRACKFSRLMAETYSSASLSHQLSLAFSITLEPQLQGPAPQSCSGWHCLYYQKTVPNFYPTAPSTLVTSHSALSLPAP